MVSQNDIDFVNKVSPEIFLKEILSNGYNKMGLSNVFETSNMLAVEQAKKSFKVDYCHSLEGFEVKLANSTRANLMLDSSIVSMESLEQMLDSSNAQKNIIIIK